MILSELNNLILTVVRSNYLVKQAYVGDVYDINSKENKFGCFVATPMNARKTTNGTINYNYVLYYIDRLTKDESNIDLVQTDAVSLLTGLMDWLKDNSIEVADGYEFTLFREKFSDWCAGAYVNVTIVVPDNDCGDDDFVKELKGEIIPFLITANGTYTPPKDSGYGPVYVDISGIVTPEWVDDEIDYKLQGYATESWVQAQGYITSETIPEDIATQSWVMSQGFLTSIPSEYVTQSWVESQQFATISWVSSQVSDTKSWVESQQFATESWVQAQGYITSETIPEDIATQSWVMSQGFLTSIPSEYATQSWVESQDYASVTYVNSQISDTMSWVLSQNYAAVTYVDSQISDTKSWVESQQFATISWVSDQISDTISWVSSQISDTMSWVLSQDYASMTYVNSQISDTMSWVLSQDYASVTYVNSQISDTMSWVLSQDYASMTYVNSQVSDTRSWATSAFFEESKIWTGTKSEWNNLTSAEQAVYTIALITL